MLRSLKQLSTTIKFKNPSDNNQYAVSILFYTYTNSVGYYGQLYYETGLLIGDVKQGVVFHNIVWTYHISKKPVKSIEAAEILSDSEGIYE